MYGVWFLNYVPCCSVAGHDFPRPPKKSKAIGPRKKIEGRTFEGRQTLVFVIIEEFSSRVILLELWNLS